MSGHKHIIGVDIAKIVAMLLVVSVHVLQDGFCPSSGLDVGGAYKLVRALLTGCATACIDVFAIASGFVCVNSRFRFSRLAELWLQVVFTCVTCAFALMLFTNNTVGLDGWLRNLMPISGARYWYMTAYFMLAFTMPFLNAGIKAMDRKQVELLLCVVLAIVCGQAFLGIKGGLGVDAGYSYAWLLILYLVGAYWRLYHAEMRFCAGFWLIAILPLALLSSVVPKFLPSVVSDRIYWEGYVSPFTLGIAVCVFGFSLSLKVNHERTQRVIRMLSSCTLGVYLFHYTPFIYGKLIQPYISRTHITGVVDFLLHYVFVVVVVYAGCTFLDYVRQLIFRGAKKVFLR